MSITRIQLSGLPDGVEVRRSTRRRKTVSAFREEGRTVVVVPQRMPTDQIRNHVSELVGRLNRRSSTPLRSDAALLAHAERLRARYLPEAPTPASVTWSTRQRRRWGSCTTAERTIRVSTVLAGMPGFVLDYILVHELAHLIRSDHGAEFTALVARFSQRERAEGFLQGFDHARTVGSTAGAAPCDESFGSGSGGTVGDQQMTAG